MIKNIEQSLKKLFKENDIDVLVSQPEKSEFVSVISLDKYTKNKIAMDNNYKVDIMQFLLHIVAGNHEQMADILERYLSFKEPLETPFVVYDFSSGLAVKDVECTISMPRDIQFNTPFGTTFMDDIIITYRRL